MAISKAKRLERLKELEYMLLNHNTLFKTPKRKSGIKFDIDLWCGVKEEPNCGTPACALGSACLHPPFIKQGLKLVKERTRYETLIYPRTRNGAEGFDAGQEFFGITNSESMYLFSPETYEYKRKVTARDVANRVRKLIKKYES